jgi:hypothetical protein
MRKLMWTGWVCLAMCMALVPCAKAQEGGNFQVGGFADYYRAPATGTNMFGLGGRVGVGVWDNTMLEGEMAYDFGRTFNNSFTQTNGSGVSFINSNVRTLHALFGPRYSFAHGPIRPFVELKGGFINYMFDPLAPGFTSFSNQVGNLRSQNINATLLAGGGVEGHVGPVGLRLDVGDEIYFNSGAHNGLRVTFGPVFRF